MLRTFITIIRNVIKVFLFTVLILSSSQVSAYAEDQTAASCSASDIQNSIDYVANSGGGTVTLPACDKDSQNTNGALWAQGDKICIASTDEIRVIGQGQDVTDVGYGDGAGPGYNPVGCPGGNGSLAEAAPIAITGVGIKEISHFSFDANGTGGIIYWLQCMGSTNEERRACTTANSDARLHHVSLTGMAKNMRGIYFCQNWRGVTVFDHIYIGNTENVEGIYGISINGGWGEEAFTVPPEFGSNNGLFIEDSIFDGLYHPIDGFYANRATVRHSTFQNEVGTTHPMSGTGGHGAPFVTGCKYGDPDEPVGTYRFEFYDNTWNAGAGIYMRSGFTVAKDNTFTVGRVTSMPETYTWSGREQCTVSSSCPYAYTGYTTAEECFQIPRAWVWDNGDAETRLQTASECNRLGSDTDTAEILTREPQSGDKYYAGGTYVTYTYPHPLTLNLETSFIVDGTNPGCSDSGPGTESTPFCTVQQGADVVSAGETVYIKDGYYDERVEVQKTGSPGKYITFAAYPGHSPHIVGDGTCGWNGVFNIEGKQYVKVDSIEMSRQSCYDSDSAGWIVYVASGEYVELSNLEVHHPGAESEHIQVMGASSNVKVNNNIVRDGKCPSGIDVYTKNGSGYEAGRPSDVEIAYNTIYNVNPSYDSCGIGAGIATERVDRAHVHHNTVYDSRMGLDIGCGKNNDIHDNDIKDCETGIAISGNEYSEIYRNSIDGSSDEGFLSYDHEDHASEVHANNSWHSNKVTNSYIPFQEYNKPSQGAAATSTGHEVYNNLFYRNSGPVRLLDSSGLKFYHNTIYANDGAPGLQIGDDGATQVVLKNNVISISGSRSAVSLDNYVAPTIEMDCNLYFNRSAETVVNFNGTIYTESDVNDDTFYSVTGNGRNSISADPLLDSAYRPGQGSPVIDTGTDVSITVDLDGNTRPIDGDISGTSEYDIGAFEYLGASAPTCSSEGYTCCRSCATGAQSQYDSTCSGLLCCESCAVVTEICDNTLDDDSDKWLTAMIPTVSEIPPA